MAAHAPDRVPSRKAQPNSAASARVVQHRCSSCGQHTVAGETCATCRQQERVLQRSALPGAKTTSGVPPIVHQALRAPGQPLDPGTRREMESRFGHDFSQVRVHTGTQAAESARAVKALAYTAGRDVVFGQGRYAPGTPSGQRLLAHELAHVVQQRGSSASAVQPFALGPAGDRYEREAEQVAGRASDGSMGTSLPLSISPIAVQRACADVLDVGANCEPDESTLYEEDPTGNDFYESDRNCEFPTRELSRLQAFTSTVRPTDVVEVHGFTTSSDYTDRSCARAYSAESVLLEGGVAPAQLELYAHTNIEPVAPGGVVVRSVGSRPVAPQSPAPEAHPTVAAPSTQATTGPKNAPASGSQGAAFMQAGWKDVNELGIVYQPGPEPKGGARLRAMPTTKSAKLRWMPQNTRLFILKQQPAWHWYAVTTVTGGAGMFGYVYDRLVARHPPDPESEVYRIEPGESPIEIAGKHYKRKGFDIWGRDLRYVVNALVWVNEHAKHNFPGETGIRKPSVSDKWWNAKSTAEVYIWLPGADYMKAIYETVAEHGGGTGSITADIWRKVKKIYHAVAYGLAFVGGLVHGFVKSLWDAVSGAVKTIVDVLVSVFTGNVLKDAKELWEAISNITWEQIKEAVGEWAFKWEKKLLSDDPWTAGHAHGYLTGYIMAEAAMLLLSGGTLEAAKAAIWGTRLGRAIKGTRAFEAFAKGLETVGEVGSEAKKVFGKAAKVVGETRVFRSLEAARKWVVASLDLSKEFVRKFLKLDEINRLRRLPEAALARIRRLSERAKKWLLGCASPCDVDLEFIERQLGETKDLRELNRKLEVAEEFEQAAQKGVRPDVVPEGTEPVPYQKSVVKLSHDAGVAGGRRKAVEDGIELAHWDNPESHIGDYGRGIDDLGREGSNHVILEWKAEASKLEADQMQATWVGRKLAQLEHLNDPMAQTLLQAARDGKLTGRVYRTTIGPGGRLTTALEGGVIHYGTRANLRRLLAAYRRELGRLARRAGR